MIGERGMEGGSREGREEVKERRVVHYRQYRTLSILSNLIRKIKVCVCVF